ncbi:MAG: ribbon-helix-helix domain-containing protein [Candidatus Heimdallarchaeota archaeon]
MRTVTVYVPEELIKGLTELVRLKYYPSRSETIRSALRDLLKSELPKLREVSKE